MSSPADDQFGSASDPFPENSVIVPDALTAFLLALVSINKKPLIPRMFTCQDSLRPDIAF